MIIRSKKRKAKKRTCKKEGPCSKHVHAPSDAKAGWELPILELDASTTFAIYKKYRPNATREEWRKAVAGLRG